MNPAPDVLLVTGDVADNGEPDSTRKAPPPGRLGRADARRDGQPRRAELFSQVLLGRARTGPLNQSLDAGAYRFLMLDSLVPAASDAPTFVGCHHPPTTMGIERVAAVQLHNPAELEPVPARHPHVAAVLVGHNHTMHLVDDTGRLPTFWRALP